MYDSSKEKQKPGRFGACVFGENVLLWRTRGVKTPHEAARFCGQCKKRGYEYDRKKFDNADRFL